MRQAKDILEHLAASLKRIECISLQACDIFRQGGHLFSGKLDQMLQKLDELLEQSANYCILLSKADSLPSDLKEAYDEVVHCAKSAQTAHDGLRVMLNSEALQAREQAKEVMEEVLRIRRYAGNLTSANLPISRYLDVQR